MSFVILFSAFVSMASAQTIVRSDLEDVFARTGLGGTFVVLTPSQNRMILINPGRAKERFIPASTFKIANSLIALNTDVVADENEVIPYGGKRQPIKSWEKDMSMRDAIKISNVPVYQEIASRVGRDRYLDWLGRLGYGNQQVGDDVQSFWLQGPLKISALEQVGFLAQLISKELPASRSSQSTVMDMLKLERSDDETLFGKTGWTNAPDPDIGWFVGWITKGETVHVFALNMDIKNTADAKLRKSITKLLLGKLEII
ncbi:MAG: class D beta-lactamase [Rhizobiaceae bacterium]|nr:class D beta-lactamase [Rhizobiaceae bacterium]